MEPRAIWNHEQTSWTLRTTDIIMPVATDRTLYCCRVNAVIELKGNSDE